MVKMEWQNALFASSKGKTRLIPVRVDGSDLPAIMRQNLYIDMHQNGLETTISQIVGLTQGNNAFIPNHENFSNLTWKIQAQDNCTELVISASHLFEPQSSIGILTPDAEEVFELDSPPPHVCGWNPQIPINGQIVNAYAYSPIAGGGISPKNPLKIKIKRGNVIGVVHREGDLYKVIPPKFD